MRTILVNPKSLSTAELTPFIDRLYEVQQAVFDGVNKDDFIRYVIHSNATETNIRVMINGKDEYVGYFALHRFELTFEGKEITVIRGETGILPAYRQHGSIGKWGKAEMLKYKLRNIFRDTYILACFVTPVTYYMTAKSAYEVYPNQKNHMPEDRKKLMDFLADHFKMSHVEGYNKYVKHVGWQVRMSADDLEKIKMKKASQFEYFLRTNPDYKKGYGLQSLYPLTVVNVAFSLLNEVVAKIHPKLKMRKG